MSRRRVTRDYVTGPDGAFEIQPPIEHPPLCSCSKCKALPPAERIRPHIYRIRRRAKHHSDRLLAALEARKVKAQEEAKLRGESPLPIEDTEDGPPFKTLARFYVEENEWKSEGGKQRNESIIDEHLIPFCGEMAAKTVKPVVWLRYRRLRREAGAAPATINREVSTVKAIFNFGVRHELLDASPIKPRTLEPLEIDNVTPDYFEPEEWRRFLAAFSDEKGWRAMLEEKRAARPSRFVDGRNLGSGTRRPDSDASTVAFARFSEAGDFMEALLYTAARVGELAGMTWNDVNVKREIFTIRQEKTRRPKTLPMARRFVEIIKARRAGVGHAALFTRSSGAPFTVMEIERAFAIALTLAGITKPLTPHAVRDTAASWLVVAGFNESTHVAEILGHARRSVTSRYAHLANASLAPAIATIERIANKGFRKSESGVKKHSQTRSQSAPKSGIQRVQTGQSAERKRNRERG